MRGAAKLSDSILGGNILFLGMLYQKIESLSHGQPKFESRTYSTSIFFGEDERNAGMDWGSVQRPILCPTEPSYTGARSARPTGTAKTN
jgi:hypothetical protein